MVGLVVTEITSCEDSGEILSPDGFVAAQRRRLGRLLDVGKVNGVPEISDRDVGLLSDSAFAVDLLHLRRSELLHRLAGLRVMLVVLLTEPLRPLHSLRLTVYNLSRVVPDMQRTMSLEHMTALITSHRFPLASSDKARIAECATSMQRLFGN